MTEPLGETQITPCVSTTHTTQTNQDMFLVIPLYKCFTVNWNYRGTWKFFNLSGKYMYNSLLDTSDRPIALQWLWPHWTAIKPPSMFIKNRPLLTIYPWGLILSYWPHLPPSFCLPVWICCLPSCLFNHHVHPVLPFFFCSLTWLYSFSFKPVIYRGLFHNSRSVNS